MFCPEMEDFSIRYCDDYDEDDASAVEHGPDGVDSADVIAAGCLLDWRMLYHMVMVRPFKNNFPQIKTIHRSDSRPFSQQSVFTTRLFSHCLEIETGSAK